MEISFSSLIQSIFITFPQPLEVNILASSIPCSVYQSIPRTKDCLDLRTSHQIDESTTVVISERMIVIPEGLAPGATWKLRTTVNAPEHKNKR